MKLISEFRDQDIEILTEAREGGGKNYYIEGIYAQAEKKNKNGRIYRKGLMERAVGKYVSEQVSQGRAVGELNHPEGPSINLDKVSHKITELNWKGNDVIGKAQILDEMPMGKCAVGLLNAGVKLGVSTRGMGSLENVNGQTFVGEDFILNTVDIVHDPSAQQAFVNGVMEGVEWVWQNGVIKPQAVNDMKEEIDQASKSEKPLVGIKVFKDFMNELSRS